MQSFKAQLALAILVAVGVRGGKLSAQDRSWKDYLGGPASAHYSNLKQITPGNVRKLESAWSYPIEEDTSYTFSPLVIDNVAYFAAKHGSIVAVDATTGKELWVHTFASGTGASARFADGSDIC